MLARGHSIAPGEPRTHGRSPRWPAASFLRHEALAARRLSPVSGSSWNFLVTHRFGLADWQQALDALRGSESPRGKVMLTIGSPQAPLEVRS